MSFVGEDHMVQRLINKRNTCVVSVCLSNTLRIPHRAVIVFGPCVHGETTKHVAARQD